MARPGNGKIESGDRLVLTFNQSLEPASVPNPFSGATETDGPLFTEDKLNIPGITNGTLGMGDSSYVTLVLPSVFGGSSTLSGSGTATTMTLVVTSLTGGLAGFGSGSMVFAPAPTIKDGGGNSAAGSFPTAGNFKIF